MQRTHVHIQTQWQEKIFRFKFVFDYLIPLDLTGKPMILLAMGHGIEL
jgi:hypothetical protein